MSGLSSSCFGNAAILRVLAGIRHHVAPSAVDPPSKELMNVKRTVLIAALGLGLTMRSTPGAADVAQAQSLETSVESPFRFELREVTSHRGPAVEGYLYNGLRWRIGNVRVRVESRDPTGQVSGEAYGWALGDVPAGGRTYFVVPIGVRGAAYHATVDSFDRVSRESPQSP